MFYMDFLFFDKHPCSKVDSHKFGKSANTINSDSVLSPKTVPNCFQNKETLKFSNFTFHVYNTTGLMGLWSEMS